MSRNDKGILDYPVTPGNDKKGIATAAESRLAKTKKG
jgi:hypothetical protein